MKKRLPTINTSGRTAATNAAELETLRELEVVKDEALGWDRAQGGGGTHFPASLEMGKLCSGRSDLLPRCPLTSTCVHVIPMHVHTQDK